MKLLKIKVILETEFVGENVDESEDLQKAARELFNCNRSEIISQAVECGELKFEVNKLEKLSELPNKWCSNCLPFTFSTYGKGKPEQKIGEILK